MHRTHRETWRRSPVVTNFSSLLQQGNAWLFAPSAILLGALAALSVKHVSRRWSGFGEFARKAPYFSSAVILMVGLYVGYQGLHALV
jgi:ABC-type nickel/cobalt efflux system permease component RcnA